VYEAAVNEFPFVEALPKREKSKLAKVWDMVNHLKEAQARQGTLLPLTLAAKALDLSRTRVEQVVADGRLKRVEVDGHVFLTLDSVIEFASTERKNGRPLKYLDSKTPWRDSVKAAIEIRREARLACPVKG